MDFVFRILVQIVVVRELFSTIINNFSQMFLANGFDIIIISACRASSTLLSYMETTVGVEPTSTSFAGCPLTIGVRCHRMRSLWYPLRDSNPRSQD